MIFHINIQSKPIFMLSLYILAYIIQIYILYIILDFKKFKLYKNFKNNLMDYPNPQKSKPNSNQNFKIYEKIKIFNHENLKSE